MQNKTDAIITIDGISGVGKGTLARALAQHFGFLLLDSGALYRLVAKSAYQNGILKDTLTPDIEGVLAEFIDEGTFEFDALKGRAWIDGVPFLEPIRDEFTASLAAKIAPLPMVRHALLAQQRRMSHHGGLVADGRDMGTLVFPHASVKLFLTASDIARAERRQKQLQQKGATHTLDEMLSQMRIRDEADQTRATAPTVPAADAHIIDTQDLDAKAVFEEALVICRREGIQK